MVLGMGLDIVDVDAFREQLEDKASHFVEGTFTFAERRDAELRPGTDPARHLAVRFAAKEALIKAWSLALCGHPPPLSHVNMHDIEVVTDAWKRPQLRLHNAVAEAIRALGPIRTLVSLSHDGSYAAAVVLLEHIEYKQESDP